MSSVAASPSADAVSDHHEKSEPILGNRKLGEVGQARLPDVESLAQRSNEKVILIGWTDEALVGQAVSIDFIVARLAKHSLELASLWSSGKNATANYN